jgi:hypothetical protein
MSLAEGEEGGISLFKSVHRTTDQDQSWPIFLYSSSLHLVMK